jgi:response regulator RpfG family c-di-GMP phosphodiesterase
MAGEEIHVYARIVALADVFDALLHRRCYKGAWPIDDVISLIESEKGKHFDPKLVDILVNNLDQFIDINSALTLPDEL